MDKIKIVKIFLKNIIIMKFKIPIVLNKRQLKKGKNAVFAALIFAMI